MSDSIKLYDVKVVVRSALKLLPEIKRLLPSNPNRLNLFRRTVFGPWLDLPSHYNDNHLMHYESIPIFNLDPTPAEKIQAWLESTIPFFNGIVDEDWKGFMEDGDGLFEIQKQDCRDSEEDNGITSHDDYMSVLNDEETIANVSLDDMKFQHEEENLPVKDTPLEHQPNLSRLDGCKKDKLACLDLAKKAGWETVTWIYGLILCGVFESSTQIGLCRAKGDIRLSWIMKIKYAFPNVVRQADESGDYGVWVCIFLYRLSRKQPLAFKDPIQTVLAYRETMLQYFWNHKFASPKAVLIDEGFGVPPDTLDPTIVKISYPVSRQGNWYVSVFTMSSETWNQVANNRLPRESIRFKRSSQAVVGGLIYWLGHERSVSNSGVFNKKTLLVSFDMNTHQFEVIDIPDIIIRPLGFPLTISNI
ncbi:hypothetical protein Tco_0574935 [Tanacetum coccineum]